MESHVLNSYHQARFRTIGHSLRANSDSISSDSNQNSPEYPQIAIQRPAFEDANVGWHNHTMNTTRSSQDTSSDDDSSEQEEVEENFTVEHKPEYNEQNIVVQEININDDHIDVDDATVDVDSCNVDVDEEIEVVQVPEDTLVEGHDYDVITVYTVNPDIDLEASSDDEDFCINNKELDEKFVEETIDQRFQTDSTELDLLDAPVVSNVDEYFIKDKDILDTDGPVVKDVDEYFIKDKGKENTTTVPNVEDFFIKHKLPEEESTQFQITNTVTNVDDFLVTKNVKKEVQEPVEEPTESDPMNESDLEVLPNIEDLKRYLLEEMTYTKFKSIQRSCSLPQSPMQNICMDIDDAKTCLSFEDLNLDLSDLAFDDKEKSDSANKSDDIPRTLTDEDVNSFLIKSEPVVSNFEDDLNPQDMEIENIEAKLTEPQDLCRKMTSTPIPSSDPLPAVLNFCIEKTPIKKERKEVIKPVAVKSKPAIDIKPIVIDSKPIYNKSADFEDFVDVESCNDTVIPVIAANNLGSLLEQFEATEKLNKSKKSKVVEEQKKIKQSLTNGMRLQDAAVQLNKNKMRQILMPSTINTVMRRSPSPVHSDHDYCSSKKRHSLPNLKGGQSLLKPEVLSSNSKILSSRHRTCKNKKVIYHLSSDDETDTKNKKVSSDSDFKKKISVKPAVKPPAQSNCRKKLSPAPPEVVINKSNSSVIDKSASKASDTPCSQNSNGSIKLTIKNKSEVILNCDHKDSQKDKLNNNLEKCKSTSVDSNLTIVKQEKNKEVDRIRKTVPSDNCNNVSVKEEPRPKEENFYTTLFSNKQDVKMPQPPIIKKEKNAFEDELNKAMEVKKEEPQKKKKINLQEYKLRRGVNSNNSSTTVSPEAIFPDMPNPFSNDKTKPLINIESNNSSQPPTKIFDPIREASRKILMNNRKQKAEALRKRDEDIVMSKIPKVENLQLQPLISDAEMMKIVGMTQPEVPATIEKPQLSADYEEIILVSVGTNTDENVFKQLTVIKLTEQPKKKSATPPLDSKSHINFKIKKSDNVLKQNIFDTLKKDKRSPVDEKKNEKIDKERYKDITATLKSVGKHVDNKMTSNSLFASIQDVVMKKAPDEKLAGNPKPKTVEKIKLGKPTIIRDYDEKAQHGEDKIILHLGKHRTKPASVTIKIQTSDPNKVNAPEINTEKVNRKRNDSDMSMSSEGSPDRKKATKITKPERSEKRSQSKEKRSRSKERCDNKYRRRSRSLSRGRRRRRSYSRSRSKSRYRYRRYRRSDSPYKRKRRSRSRSYKRRSPSPRREKRSKSRSRNERTDRSIRSSPVPKKAKPSPDDKNSNKSMTPPLRKPTVSESSDSSSSSSSQSSSSSSSSSSSASRTSYKREEYRKGFRSFSSEDRENNTPVEERRIVFVGKLEKDITKATLRSQFSKFGQVMEVRLHSKEDGSRYGFVTYHRARDAWSAVETASSTYPHYDVGFGGRRAFCRQSYADLDGLEAKYTESVFHSGGAVPTRRTDDMSFEQMLQEMKKKLSQRKTDKKREDNP